MDQPEPHKILFVDDDPLALRAAVRLMHDSGIKVKTASCAEEALEILDEEEYPVVMSDYRMPGINGIQFLERLRHIWPNTVCILTSGQADLETAVQAINRVGLYRFLTKPWDPSELKAILRSACEHFDLAVENRQLVGALERRNTQLRKLNETLDLEVHRRTTQLLVGMLNALDLRDTETQGHSRRVALYARELALQLGLDDDKVLDIERGALLHDIGKIGVSDTILLKPGKLTDEEWLEMRKHTMYGYRIVESIEFLGEAAFVVRNHHERYDGEGYPDGLSHDRIYIGARIFAVIDTYDAITSDRPYRKALSPNTAKEEILKHRGTQFDPDCVDTFLEIPQTKLDELRARISETAHPKDSLTDYLSPRHTKL